MGGVGLVLAVAVALQSRSFRVTFLTDPIGPRALPWLAAFLVAVGALALLVRPARDEPDARGGAGRRVGAALLTCLAYAALVAPIGFFVATALLGFVLSLLFGARPVRGLIAAIALSGVLWVLFAWLLGLPLPAGELFFETG